MIYVETADYESSCIKVDTPRGVLPQRVFPFHEGLNAVSHEGSANFRAENGRFLELSDFLRNKISQILPVLLAIDPSSLANLLQKHASEKGKAGTVTGSSHQVIRDIELLLVPPQFDVMRSKGG